MTRLDEQQCELGHVQGSSVRPQWLRGSACSVGRPSLRSQRLLDRARTCTVRAATPMAILFFEACHRYQKRLDQKERKKLNSVARRTKKRRDDAETQTNQNRVAASAFCVPTIAFR